MHPDIPAIDTWDCLFQRTEKPFPDDHIIFKSPSGVRTYNDIRSRAQNFGAHLQSKWIWSKGDVLLTFSPNYLDAPSVYWGCHWAGGIVSPANPTYTADELKYQIIDSNAKAIVVHVSLRETALAASKLVGFPTSNIWVMGASSSVADLQHVESMLSVPTAAGSRPRINPAVDTAYLVYSSGTTGSPKGAMVTHTNVVADIILQRYVEGEHLDWRKDRFLALIPTYHIFGLICLVHFPALMGLQTIIMEKFSVNEFLKNVKKESITHVYVAPPIVLYLAKNPSMTREHLASLRMLTSGGAPLAPDLIRTVYDRLKIPVRQAFGLTESTAVAHIQRWNQWREAMGSNGPPMPTVEVKFINEEGAQVHEGEGELCLRGPTIFRGYHNNAETTARSITPDGWFMSGDVGYQDQGGNLYITDRLKDLIKFKGFQIPPAEIEGVLHEHPLVHDAAVIGVFVPEIASEVPVAYVVLAKTTQSPEQVARELLAHVAEKLTVQKRIRGGIIPIAEIPKGPSGKILKRVLRARAEGVDKGKALGAAIYDGRSSKL
ncbi:unnamed protein product [Penicillium salamii]|uniref:Uncharacterized protein n=1 Tax=Penicillium salamii TaxID=1612424 RepID=A0A9W4J8C7_9EURO|nr:unnamed protein product [Penicillium salamii]